MFLSRGTHSTQADGRGADRGQQSADKSIRPARYKVPREGGAKQHLSFCVWVKHQRYADPVHRVEVCSTGGGWDAVPSARFSLPQPRATISLLSESYYLRYHISVESCSMCLSATS